MSADEIETVSDRASLVPERTRTVSTHVAPQGAQVEDDLGLAGCAGSCCCHPRAFCHRLIALILMCLLGFGSYFCFDNPGALQVKYPLNHRQLGGHTFHSLIFF